MERNFISSNFIHYSCELVQLILHHLPNHLLMCSQSDAAELLVSTMSCFLLQPVTFTTFSSTVIHCMMLNRIAYLHVCWSQPPFRPSPTAYINYLFLHCSLLLLWHLFDTNHLFFAGQRSCLPSFLFFHLLYYLFYLVSVLCLHFLVIIDNNCKTEMYRILVQVTVMKNAKVQTLGTCELVCAY